MKKFFALMAVGLMMLMAHMAFVSCSGSSGGGGGDGASSSAPATLDASNVDKTVDYIVQNVPGCTQGTMLTANQVILDTVATLKHKASEKNVSVFPSAANAYQPAAEEILLEGNCAGGGGTVTADISANESSGDISGDISFNDFCQEASGSTLAVDGSLKFSGNVDPDSGDINQLSGSSKGITIDVNENGEQRSYSMSFNAALSMSGDTLSVTVDNFTFADDTKGMTVRLMDFSMAATEGATSTQVVMSGTIDVTDQGSVQFQTDPPLTVSDDGETIAGALVMNGADNTGMVVSIDNGLITVQADTDGDGSYDYFPDTLDCTGVALDDISF